MSLRKAIKRASASLRFAAVVHYVYLWSPTFWIPLCVDNYDSVNLPDNILMHDDGRDVTCLACLSAFTGHADP